MELFNLKYDEHPSSLRERNTEAVQKRCHPALDALIF